MHSQENGPQAPASDLPGVDSSHSLRAVDEEQVKARTWNGYVCPGCRTVFRVAGDFNGTDVICPSCHETLRLPKSSDEPQPLTVPAPAEPQPVTMAAATPQAPSDSENGQSVLQTLLSTRDGQIKLALALLIPLAVIATVLLVFPPGKESPPPITTADSQAIQPEPEIPAKSAPQPPPPPVAMGEEPIPTETTPPEPVEPSPLPGIAAHAPTPEPIETPPPSMPVAQAPEPDHGLVAAIPDKPVAVEKTHAPGVMQEAPPETAPPIAPPVLTNPPALTHAVVKGDTLIKISSRYQVAIATIRSANGLKSDVLLLGRKLEIPGGVPPAAVMETKSAPTPPTEPPKPRFHTVVKGDTLTRIARKYQADPREIMKANGMHNDVVRLGRKLVIPPR